MTLIIGISVLVLSVLALIYMFLISPRVKDPADMEALVGSYAHRGLWDAKVPENSLGAFELACRNKYGIELDIQLSKDRKIVVFHDDNLKRMCGVDRRVCELTLAELKELRLKDTNETIPTFAEVLQLVRGRVPLLVEVKGEKPTKALCEGASAMLDAYRGAFCVESFSPLIIRWFKLYRPAYARGQLVTKITKGDRKGSPIVAFLLTHMMLNFLSRPDFIAINGNMRRRFEFIVGTKVFSAKGFIWTVKDQDDYATCRRAGHSVIFENFLPRR